MLFNSYEFIFLFLPITLGVFYILGARGQQKVALAWLVLASLFFYGWWNPLYLALIVPSIVVNYILGVSLSVQPRRWVLVGGLAANLAVLGYFKYANFFITTLSLATGSQWVIGSIVLPLGISFITFQKIAYLVDAYRGETREYDFLRFCLFVTFFPQLIAGPIVHHKEIIPQFRRRGVYHLRPARLATGVSIFVIGLLKKVLIADGLARFSTMAFDAVTQGIALSFFEAWRGALAYSLQLYFDFSGYSDMALGLALMVGVRLPLNFNSPYKAVNIIDFWRRWHMTLSRFLREYVYLPLGGNRRGKPRRYLNLMATMLLGGLWHGAGWTFVAWGGLHGIYLVINHAWQGLQQRWGRSADTSSRLGRFVGRCITFSAVTVGWVFFRAEDFSSARRMLAGMAGINGVIWPQADRAALGPLADLVSAWGWQFQPLRYFDGSGNLIMMILMVLLVWWLPNTQQIMAAYRPAVQPVKKIQCWPRWRMSTAWAVVIAIGGLVAVLRLSHVSEFLYFRF
ncbi:MAG: MBOAT family protein [Gammaproteobacteria bacterium]|nr:MBOAT family protein [Gammaproteobacteria bacterium]